MKGERNGLQIEWSQRRPKRGVEENRFLILLLMSICQPSTSVLRASLEYSETNMSDADRIIILQH